MNRMPPLRLVALRRAGIAGALLLAGLVAACEGSNAWTDLPTGGAARKDTSRPTVEIQLPDSTHRVAVHDSVLVRVRVSDDVAVDSVSFSGFALRGSAALGTQTRVERFHPKTVKLGGGGAGVRDTVLERYLLPTADSLRERPVLLVVSARDGTGKTHADTVRISIGGPRVQIVSPAGQSDVHAGSQLRVRVTAADTLQPLKELVLRARGAFSHDTTLRFDPALGRVDTTVVVNVPGSARESLELVAVARTVGNDTAVTVPTQLRVLASVPDRSPPTVRFRVAAPARGELLDSVAVTVAATDSSGVRQVGVTILPTHRLAARTDTLRTVSRVASADSATFRFALADFGVTQPTDTSTLRLEVTGFARDLADNCATSSVAGTPLSEGCVTDGQVTRGVRAGARTEILLVQGSTARAAAGDVLVDIVSDGRRVYVSNRSQNRVEVLPLGAGRFTGSVAVGSQPWGMALSPNDSLLYVANSGGTNISVVDVAASTPRELTSARIQTPNIRVFLVPFAVDTVDVAGRREPRQIPSRVTKFDYSDRPQFIAHTQGGQLFYSTRPTGAAPDGTIRRYDLARRRVELFTAYVENQVRGQVVVLNADSVKLLESLPAQLVVYPRPLPSDSGRVPAFVGYIEDVSTALTQGGYDTRFQYFLDINELGLSDTTFVAVSGDRRSVAFGEGVRSPGRIILFRESGGGVTRQGEVRDLVNNASERVTGLSLNSDGSLGIARGSSSSFVFDRDLRLEGSGIASGRSSGGVEMHPASPVTQRAFVSGVEADGLAFVDVIDTFHFRRVRRIFIRDTVTGPIRAVRMTDGTLKLYALTDRGVVAIDVRAEDL